MENYKLVIELFKREAIETQLIGERICFDAQETFLRNPPRRNISTDL
jgi:hypothetical protein